MKKSWGPKSLVAAFAWLMVAPHALGAQLYSPSTGRLDFNFNPPGARAAAMGGAFIPLADDATAAESNPAGLTVLLRPEVAFEYKSVSYTRTIQRENLGGDFTSTASFPSFASVVFPVRGVTLAAFRHELVNYGSQYSLDGPVAGGQLAYSEEAGIDFGVVNYGAAAGIRLGEVLSVGLAGGVSTLNFTTDETFIIATQTEGLGGRFRVADEDGQGTAPFVNLGAIFRLNERVSLGGVYKRRPKFDQLTERGLVIFIDQNGQQQGNTTNAFRVNVPDAFGLGVAARATDQFTVVADAEVVRYSELAEAVNEYNVGSGLESVVRADDGVNLRAGAEYIAFLGSVPLALRAGVARNAGSNIYEPGADANSFFAADPDGAQFRYSFGAGAVLAGRFNVDAAAVFGEQRNEFAVGLVYRFGKQ